jgi:hypothetical protein
MQVSSLGFAQDKAHGWEDDLVVTTAVVLFDPPNDLVRKVYVQAISGDIRWTPDGSTPDADHGGLIMEGDIVIFEMDPPTLRRVQGAAVGASATLSIGYFGI